MAVEFHPLAGPLPAASRDAAKPPTQEGPLHSRHPPAAGRASGQRWHCRGALAIALLSRLLSTRRCSHPIARPVGSLVTAAQAVRPCAAR